MTKNSPCFSANVDLALEEKLRKDLEEQGFIFSQPPYTRFLAKKKGVSCALYTSGKITVQGKEMESFIEFYLEPEILKEFRFSQPEAHLDLTPRIGMDEAGKGDFFGPLCIASLYANAEGIKQLLEWGVRDSKRLGDETIVKLAGKIRSSFSYKIISLFPPKYNELYGKFKNLNRLMAWAHTAALEELSQRTGCKNAILDQFADKSVVERQIGQKKMDVQLEQKVRGEEDLVVAGASILARAAFLDGMQTLSEEYGLNLPKGASHLVKIAARSLIAKWGEEVLSKVAKMHFKTASECLPGAHE